MTPKARRACRITYKLEETADPSSNSSSQKKFQPQYIEKIRHFIVKQNLSDMYLQIQPYNKYKNENVNLKRLASSKKTKEINYPRPANQNKETHTYTRMHASTHSGHGRRERNRETDRDRETYILQGNG